MFVKVTNGQPSKFPYTLGELRRDNPNVSFPKTIPDATLEQYGVFSVKDTDAPKVDSKVKRLVKGVSLVDGTWTVTWTEQNLSEEAASDNVRGHRNTLLKDTDYLALSDNTLSAEMATYRQALRDITSQEGFPYNITWPIKPE